MRRKHPADPRRLRPADALKDCRERSEQAESGSLSRYLALQAWYKPDPVNSVYAQNGLGKTSLFEAISYAILLAPKQERGVSPSDIWA